jgi:signal peptidase II
MKTKLSTINKSILIILLVIIADQWLKIYVKTHFAIGESVRLSSWSYIYFIENNGMAFGMEIISKIFLTLFRIVAVGLIGYMIYKLIKKDKYPFGFIACLSLILAGAFGNIIDCVLYGVMFSESTHFQVAQIFPASGGYASLFYGKVVDMFYFPIIETTLPDWLPIWGGDYFVFFSPVFNIADSAITCGVLAMIIFYRKQLNSELKEDKK